MIRAAIAAVLLLLTAACAGDGPAAPPGSTTGGATTPKPTAPLPGILLVSSTGLPDGIAPELLISGPLPASSYTRTATGNATYADVPAGRYSVTVRTVRGKAGSFTGFPASLEVDVSAGGPAVTATASYRPVPSALALTISGLPTGTAAAVSVTPPNGTPSPVTQSTVLTASQNASGSNTADLWRIAAQEVQASGARFTPSPTSLDSLVPFGDTLRTTVQYTIATGSIAVAITGLPTGAVAPVQLLAPDNVARAIPATATITGLAPGRYRVVSASTTLGGLLYRPTTDTLAVTVVASLVAAPATVSYVAQAGRVALTVSGLPSGVNGALTLTGPNGVTRSATATATFDSLPVGSYLLRATSVATATDRYAPTPASQTLTIATGATTAAAVAYASVPTAVDVTVSGLPSGTNAAITLTPPTGDAITVTGTQRIAPAAAGRWRLAASSVSSATARYTPTPAARDTTVSPGDTLRFPVTYAVATGSLAVTVTGVPAAANAAVTVTGPAGFSRVLTASSTLTLLTPGTYTITAATISSGGLDYLPTPTTQTVQVAASLTNATATVSYTAQNLGTLSLTVSGLPAGANAAITVSGPGGYSRSATASSSFTQLTLGSYTVAATAVTVGSSSYLPTPASQTVTVAALPAIATAMVTYARQSSGGGGSSSPTLFDIDIRFVGTPSTTVSSAFSAAAARWKQVITANLHNTLVNTSAGTCGSWIPAISETVNDLVIYARVAAIDGVGNIVGRASPCLVNSGTNLPAVGYMEFDEDDLATFIANGRFTDVVLHEMGHVLGIGSLWSYSRSLLSGAGGADPFFTGAAGRAQFASLNTVTYSGTPVPVENTGGAGTADAHWRETVFGRELMTGFINTGTTNPLSRVTVGSLQDLGYTVSLAAADAFSITAPLLGGFGPAPLPLGADVPVDGPLYQVLPNGTLRPIRR